MGAKLKEFQENREKNVFIIMPYKGKEKALTKIESIIKGTLKDYGFTGVLARDRNFEGSLWEHIKFCMEYSRYAVFVFGNTDGESNGLNIAIEYGYMSAKIKDKECLVLRLEGTKVPTNMGGRYFKDLDPYAPEDSIGKDIEEWLEGLNHCRLCQRRAEILENNVDRTKSIISELEESLRNANDNDEEHTIRHAAIISSFAISDSENDQLLIQERNSFETMVARGFIVRLIICPEIYGRLVEDKIRTSQEAKNKIVPRFNQLISFLNKNVEKSNLQIVCAPLLARFFLLGADFLIILDNKKMFRGRKKRGESSFIQTSLIHDSKQIDAEIRIFDESFKEWASEMLGLETSELYNEKLGSKELKEKVIKSLEREKARIESYI